MTVKYVPPPATASPPPPTSTVDPDPAWNPKRGPGGQFEPGHGGRKRGSRNRTSRETLSAVQGIAPDAVARLRELVGEKNFAAIRLVLEYTLPRGGRTIDLDATANPHDIIEAVTTGEISPDEMARISQGWKTAVDAGDLADLKSQVEALENLINEIRK